MVYSDLVKPADTGVGAAILDGPNMKMLQEVEMKKTGLANIGACIAAVLLGCVSIACQPTPKNEIVTYKGDDSLKTIIHAAPCPAATYEAPPAWTASIPGITEDVNIAIDADILVPNVTSFPVIRVAPAEITAELAERIVEKLADGRSVYDGRVPYTKKEILRFIANITENIENPQSSFHQSYKEGSEEYDRRLEEYEKAIAAWQKRLEDAPEDKRDRPLEYVFTRADEAYGVKVQDTDEPDIARFVEINSITKENDVRVQSFVFFRNETAPFNNQSITYYNLRESLAQNATLSSQVEGLKNCAMTVSEAEAVAREFLASIGITDMSVFLCCSANQFNEETDQGAKTIFDYSQCYVLYFTKNLNGINVLYQANSYSAEIPFERYWPTEYIRVVVNDRGVSEFYWSSPYKELHTINENVGLLDFSIVQERIGKMLAMQIEYAAEDPAIIRRDIIINRIVLGYIKLREKDTGNQMLVPAWNCYGYETNHYREQQPGGYLLDENNCYTQDIPGHCFLTLNAIDGSVIDRSLGY